MPVVDLSETTIVELWMTLLAVPLPTMPSLQLDTENPAENNTTLSETHGVLAGETKDTSRSLLTHQDMVSLESKESHGIQRLTDFILKYD